MGIDYDSHLLRARRRKPVQTPMRSHEMLLEAIHARKGLAAARTQPADKRFRPAVRDQLIVVLLTLLCKKIQ